VGVALSSLSVPGSDSDPNFSLIGPLVSPSRPILQVHLAWCPRSRPVSIERSSKPINTLGPSQRLPQPNVDLNTPWSFNRRRRCSCKARNQSQYTPRALARPHSLIRPSFSSPVLQASSALHGKPQQFEQPISSLPHLATREPETNCICDTALSSISRSLTHICGAGFLCLHQQRTTLCRPNQSRRAHYTAASNRRTSISD
jgi:hypothetical protein